ncbi:MAG: hypothetical protein V5A46_01975 [Haloferacaceae archaeon]
METRTAPTPRFGSPTRVDVTDRPAEELPELARRHRVRGAELHLERRGGRTYLVAEPGA